MVFDNKYFEDEVRDGFYVTSDMKHAWAAQLEILADVDKVCRLNNIEYFAEWGTLLGAVRHHGYIPWDDDMDICMKRQDYNKFLQIAEREMPEGYKLFNINSDNDNDNMLTRVINGRTIDFSKEHLAKYNGFPFVAGIDIFPLDFIAPNKEEDDFQCEIIDIVNSVAKYIRKIQESNIEITEDIAKEIEQHIEQVEQLCGVCIDRNNDIVQQLNILVDRLCSLYSENEAEYLTIMTMWQAKRKYKFPKRYYQKSVRIPFENMDIPVPYAYDEILKKKYGNYMKLVHTWDSHDYPFYERQVKILENRRKVKLWGYKSSYNEYRQYKELINKFRKDKQKIKEASLKKKVVFMPYKAEYWNMLDGLWQEYNNRDDVELKVVPIPYYYKKYDGTIEQYKDEAEYPDYIKVISYKDYDYKEDMPDEIIIQNPYDNNNMAGTVDPEYYSQRLALYTDKLIYIPYFIIDEIDDNDMRAYKSMDSYVTMPGVVYADEVIVQSDNIKKAYVRKLTEYYGDETYNEWNRKIKESDFTLINTTNYNYIPLIWKERVKRNDGSIKKLIFYYIGMNGFIEYGDKMIKKIHKSMRYFNEMKDDIEILLGFEGDVESVIKDNNSLLIAYKNLLNQYKENIIPNRLVNTAVKVCDAYYGDACAIAQRCRNEKKPVMVQDVNV